AAPIARAVAATATAPTAAAAGTATRAGGNGAGAHGRVLDRPTGEATRPFFASPRARLRSRELGIDLLALVGTGPGGRIIEADVLETAEQRPEGTRTAAPPIGPTEARPPVSPAVRQLATSLGVD